MIKITAQGPTAEALASCLEKAAKVVRAGGVRTTMSEYADGSSFTLDGSALSTRELARGERKSKKGTYEKKVKSWADFWESHSGSTWSIDDLARATGCSRGAAGIAITNAVRDGIAQRCPGKRGQILVLTNARTASGAVK